MTELPAPIAVAQKLAEAAQSTADTTLQQSLHQGAETINYLLILLKECEVYIEGASGEDHPPRFIKAVQAVLA